MDQVDRLILEIQGRDQLEQLTQQLKQEEAELLNANRLFRQGGPDIAIFAGAQKAAAASVIATRQEIEKLVGSSGKGGRGLLGASYAVQDLSSQFQNLGKTFDAGDIQRAMGSVANNVDQIATAMGATVKTAATMSLAFTGLTVAVPVLAGVFKALWEQIMGPSEAEIDKKMEKIKDKMKATHDEIQRLIEAPTTTEEEEAGRLKDLLSQRPTAEAVKGGIVAFARTGRVPGRDIFTDEQQKMMNELQQQYLASNFDQAQKIWGRMEQLREQARGGYAERLISGGLQAGPAGARARTQLADIARGAPELFPGGLAADIEQPPLTRAEQARIEAEGRRNARQFEKERDRELEQRQKRAAVQDAQRTQKDLADEEAVEREKKRVATDLRQRQRAAAAQLKRETREGLREEGEEVKAGREELAGQLVGRGASIVDQTIGPAAGAMAERANRGEIEAIKQKTIQNLEAGQLPYDAVTNAFRAIVEQIQRDSVRAQRFVGQMNGISTQVGQGARMMMGGDQNGHFPQTPALWP